MPHISLELFSLFNLDQENNMVGKLKKREGVCHLMSQNKRRGKAEEVRKGGEGSRNH